MSNIAMDKNAGSVTDNLRHGPAERVRSYKQLESTLRCIGSLRQLGHRGKELLRLPDEESVVNETLNCSHRNSFRLGWTNDRTGRELPAEEWSGLRHDQI